MKGQGRENQWRIGWARGPVLEKYSENEDKSRLQGELEGCGGEKNNGQNIGDWMKQCGGLGVWWRNMSRLSQTHTKCSCHTHMVTEHMAFSQSWRKQKTNPYHSKTMVQFSKQRPYSVPDSSCWELVGYWSQGRGTVTWWTSFFLASWSRRQCRPGLFSARTHLKHTHSLIWQNVPLYPVSWC